MKKERQFLMRKCGHCSATFLDPLTIFRLPDEIGFLAESLELPAETVTAMIDRREIPTRKTVDKNGRFYGPVRVLLDDARKALERAACAESRH